MRDFKSANGNNILMAALIHILLLYSIYLNFQIYKH